MSTASTFPVSSYYSAYLATTAHTLLPENLASLITAISLATRLSIRTSSIFMEALLETAKHSTSLGLGLSRQALIAAVSSAKRLHLLTYGESGNTNVKGLIGNGNVGNGNDAFLQVLDKYTNLGVYVIHHTFSLAELFAMSGFQLTTQTVKTGFRAAEESVRLLDGLFGSNETSRALASIIALVRREVTQDDSFELSRLGKIAILTGLTKAMTAFAFAQNVTHKRFMREVKMTKVWEGVVVVQRKEGNTGMGVIVGRSESGDDGWVEVQQVTEGNTEDKASPQQHTNIIQELETLLVTDAPEREVNGAMVVSTNAANNGGKPPVNMFEVTTTTRTTTTKTTSIRPVVNNKLSGSLPAFYPPPMALVSASNQTSRRDPTPGTKTIVVREDEEQVESFRAAVHNDGEAERQSIDSGDLEGVVVMSEEGKGSVGRKFKFTLSSVTNKLKKKKVVREEYLERSDSGVAGLGNTAERGGGGGGRGGHGREGSLTMTHSRTTTTSMQLEHQENQQHFEMPEEIMPGSFVAGSGAFNGRAKGKDKGKDKGKEEKQHSLFRIKFPKIGDKVTNGTPEAERRDNGSGSIGRNSKSVAQANAGPYTHGHRRKNQSVTSIASVSVSHMSSTTTTTTKRNNNAAEEPSPLSLEPRSENFPSQHIIKNVTRFMRYASAAYGDSFMRILGIGSLKDQVFPSTASTHPNHHAFSHHTGIPMDDILLSSYTDQSNFNMNHPQMHALVHYVNIDHEMRCVVVTCRGTLGLSDVLTDLTCEYGDIEIPGTYGGKFRAHAGMLSNAQFLTRPQGKIFKVVRDALDRFKDYGLVLCGHSLGGGVASLLAVLWSEPNPNPNGKPFVINEACGLPAGRPLHCYGYGTPSVMSLELSKYCGRGLVTTVINAYDIVASLSLGLLKDFKNVAVSLYEDKGTAEEILGRVVGVYKRRMRDNPTASSGPVDIGDVLEHGEEEEEDLDQAEADWFWSIIKTMRADMKSDKLYPPSTIYHIETTPTTPPLHPKSQRTTTTQQTRLDSGAYKVLFTRCDDAEERFSEILFARSMFSDHNPRNYGDAIELLEEGVFGEGRI